MYQLTSTLSHYAYPGKRFHGSDEKTSPASASRQAATMCYTMSTKTVGVRELRQNFSRFLKEVKAGETFHVTERGRIVAALGPARKEPNSIEELIAQGVLRPPRLDLLDLGPPLENPRGISLSEALEELREDKI